MTPPRYARILVPVDFSPASRAALEHAIFLAERLHAKVDVLHVWQTPDALRAEELPLASYGIERGIGPHARGQAERMLADFVRPYRDAGADLHTDLVFGHALAVIRKKAEDGWYDLIVMGTLGRTGLSRLLLGSVAEELVRTAPCPVLTVRADESRPERMTA